MKIYILGVVAILGLAGCGKDGSAATACTKDTDCKGDRVCAHGACEEPAAARKTGQQTTAGTPPPTTEAPAVKAVTTPEQQSYPLGNLKAISDACSAAHTVLATAPDSVAPSYEWQWSRQAMLANQQFKSIAGRPSAHGEVTFDVYHADAKFNNAWVLVASCADGATCNRLAGMYKAVVKSSHPEQVCGDLPASYGRSQKNLDLLAGGPRSNLPANNDTVAKCARVAACTIATTPSTPDDVGIQCQKAPSQFKLDCAARYPCAEVMACLNR